MKFSKVFLCLCHNSVTEQHDFLFKKKSSQHQLPIKFSQNKTVKLQTNRKPLKWEKSTTTTTTTTTTKATTKTQLHGKGMSKKINLLM